MSDLNSQLLTINNRLSEIENKILELNSQLDPLQKKRVLISSKEMLKINSELDDNGKKKYSNERMRRAALPIFLSENEEFQQLLDEMKVIEDKKRELRAEGQKLNNERIYILIELGFNPFDSQN